LLAERSPEDIAAALARLYRARLPSPEDILDPGQNAGRSRDDRGRGKDDRSSRDDDRGARSRPKTGKSSARHGMTEGSVWFRAAIGRKKNAEARWLLPMFCRRGGIDKQDIGRILIGETSTEFEISERAAESFAAKIRRPDKEDNIRIEPLADAPRDHAPAEKRPHKPRRDGEDTGHRERQNDKARDERGARHHGQSHSEKGSGFHKDAGLKTKKKHKDRPGYAEQPQRGSSPPAKRPFGKKPKKKDRRG
jgi:ATP-dependent RNA helicase DeaD